MARARSLTEFQSAFPEDEASCAAFLRNGAGRMGSFVRLGSHPRGRAEEPGIHLRMLRLRSPDFDHGGHGDAPHKASFDGMVLGRTFDVDTFKRHVGAATGRSARPHLQDGLAGGAEAAAIDGRPREPTPSKGWLKSIGPEIPFREGDTFFDPGNAGKILVIGAVEVIERDTNQGKPRRKHAKYLDTRSGRIRLAVIADNTAASIEAFVRANVKPGATLLTDGHASYPGLTDYRHDPRIVGKMAAHIVLPWIHRVFALVKRWGLGTYHGLRRKHADTYLNEFVFRYNRRFYRHASFETVLGLTAHHAPASYWDIIGRANPRKGTATPRRAPRSRKTATGMRQDGTGGVENGRQNQAATVLATLNVDRPGTTQ